jgi:hypothetical protein
MFVAEGPPAIVIGVPTDEENYLFHRVEYSSCQRSKETSSGKLNSSKLLSGICMNPQHPANVREKKCGYR